MAIEQLRSDVLSDEQAEVSYLLTAQASTTAAKALLLSTAASTFNGLPIRTRSCSVQEQAESGTYLGTAVYGTSGGTRQVADLEVGDTRILFSTVGGTTHITQSLSTEYSDSTLGFVEDHKGAIGVQNDGSVAGTDIFAGAFDFSVVKVIASTDLDTSYLSDLASLTTPNPRTNNATFAHTDSDGRAFSFAAGESLILGFTNTPRGNGEDELRFEFKASANLTGITVGDIAGVPKGGWEHLWVHYAAAEDATANKLVRVPESVFVEKVYEAGDFSLISL